MTTVPRPRVIPLTPLERLYRALGEPFEGEAGQKAQLSRARAFAADPVQMRQLFVDSVAAAGAYENRSESFLRSASDRKPLPDVPTGVPTRTPEVASLLRSRSVWETVDGSLRFTYVERELRPFRSTGNVRYAEALAGRDLEMQAAQTPMLDVLLMDRSDGAPIVGEVKLGGDQNLFYALVQGLMHVAALAGSAQRARLVKAYAAAATGLAQSGPLDLYLVGVSSPPRGTRPALALLAQEIAQGVFESGRPAGVLRRIVALKWDQHQRAWDVDWRAGA